MQLTIEWDASFKRLVRAWARKNPAYTATQRIALALDTLMPRVSAEVQRLIQSQSFSGSNYQYTDAYARDKQAAVGHSKRLILGGEYAASWTAKRTTGARAGTFGNIYRWGVGPDPNRKVRSSTVAGGRYRLLNRETITFAELGNLLEDLGIRHQQEAGDAVHDMVTRHLDVNVIREIDYALGLGRH